MEQNFTIPAFAEPITALADTPACSAAELRRRFQAPAEELRQAHNALAVCVEGITDATYPETVTEDMLTADLADKINAKADETSVSERLAAETAAREDADTKLQTQVAKKCEISVGTYTGTGKQKTQNIRLGYQPSAVLIASTAWRGDYFNPQVMNLLAPNASTENGSITSTGFQVKQYLNTTASEEGDMNPYRYIAFR